MRQQWHRHPKTLRVCRIPTVPERYVLTCVCMYTFTLQLWRYHTKTVRDTCKESARDLRKRGRDESR